MSRLRIYERNGGDMLKLVRFRKKSCRLHQDVKKWYAADRCLHRRERTGIILALVEKTLVNHV